MKKNFLIISGGTGGHVIPAENIANYTQLNPIIDAGNPFGDDFDASLIWGPVMGRTIYLGIRYSLD